MEDTIEEIDIELKKAELKKLQEIETMLNKIKIFLYQYYTSSPDPIKADFHFTTQQIYEQLIKLFPSICYTPETVAIWLNEGGYTWYDFGEMKFEWLLKKV